MSSSIKFCIIFFFSLSISLLNLTTYADPGKAGGHGNKHGKGYGHGSHKNGLGKSASAKNSALEHKARGTSKIARFSKTDKTTITNFFDKTPYAATALPPGIAMNLARGKPLPPGIAKRFLPQDLLSTLPVRPGYEYLAAGNNVVLVNSTTGIIEDVLSGVLK